LVSCLVLLPQKLSWGFSCNCPPKLQENQKIKKKRKKENDFLLKNLLHENKEKYSHVYNFPQATPKPE
jgi:hypothetical protein